METTSVPTVLFVDERNGKSVAKQPIQDVGDETKGLLDLNIPWQQELETTPSSSSSFSFPSPPPEEQPIQDAGNETKGLLDLNIPWQPELETTPSSSSSSSFSFPSPPPEEQHIKYDSDKMTDEQDSGWWHPFLRPKKRKFPAELLIQENAPIGETASRKYKTEAIKNTQICGCFSHCSPGNAPASVGGQDSDQVEEHQDQASPRNTANLGSSPGYQRWVPLKPNTEQD